MQLVFVKNGIYFAGKIKDLRLILASLDGSNIPINILASRHLH